MPADYDGDGSHDIAVFGPSSGTWFVRNGGFPFAWGTAGDIPLPLPSVIGEAFFT